LELLQKLKKVPSWGWAVIGTAVGGIAILLLRGRQSSPVLMTSPAEPQTQYSGPAPSSGAGTGPTVDMTPLLGALAALQQQTAQQAEALGRVSQAQTAQSTALSTLSGIMSGRQLVVVPNPVTQSPTVVTAGRTAPVTGSVQETVQSTPVAKGVQQAATQVLDLAVWKDDNTTAGYESTKVVIDTTSPAAAMEKGIYDAKQAYYSAESRGDRAGMDAAHAEAQRIRTEAQKAGITLGDWATKGANAYDEYRAKQS
jgi:hypothetical protein